MWNRISPGLLAGLLAIGAAQGQAPGRELTLSEAIRVALERRAELDVARAGVAAASGALRQADVGPNPVLSLQTEDWRFHGTPAFSAKRDLVFFASVSQRIETGGKRRLRTDRAKSGARIAAVEQEAIEWGLRQAVTRAYWRALAAGQRERLLTASLESAGDLAHYHEVRWREGASSEADWIKVRLEQDKVSAAVTAASLQAEQARLELLRQIGEPAPVAAVALRDEPLAAAVSRQTLGVPPGSSIQGWIETALRSRAEIRLQRALVESAAATVLVAEAAAKPDVTPYVGYKKSGPFSTLVGGVSLPLPIRDRNKGRIDQTHSLELQQRARLRAAEMQVRGEVASAAAALRKRGELLESLRAGMTARALETYEIAQAAYREGAVDLLYLLDARRTHNEVALLRTQVVYDYQLSWIELETAVGVELQADTAKTLAMLGGQQ